MKCAVELASVLSSQFWYWMYGMLPPEPQWMAVCHCEGCEVMLVFQSE